MAFTWNGQAKADVTSATLIAETPFLIKKFRVVADSATAEEALHGEDRAPDMVIITSVDADPAAAVSHQAPTTAATQIKIDVEAAETVDVYMIWFSQASGGLENVS